LRRRCIRLASRHSLAQLAWEPLDKSGTTTRRVLKGSRQTHAELKTTTYRIKNNAPAAVPAGVGSSDGGAHGAGAGAAALYVDHEADARHGGYIILTTDNAIKSTTAFTRYRFALEPQEEVTFAVEERATHYSHQTGVAQLKKLLAAELDEAVLQAADRTTLAAMVARAERRERLRKVEGELRDDERGDGTPVSARELHAWREQGALPERLLDGLNGLHALKAQRGACASDPTRSAGAHAEGDMRSRPRCSHGGGAGMHARASAMLALSRHVGRPATPHAGHDRSLTPRRAACHPTRRPCSLSHGPPSRALLRRAVSLVLDLT
jgi:hypothetical protein